MSSAQCTPKNKNKTDITKIKLNIPVWDSTAVTSNMEKLNILCNDWAMKQA